MTSKTTGLSSEQSCDSVIEENSLLHETTKDRLPTYSEDQSNIDDKANETDVEFSKSCDRRKFFYALRMCFIFVCLLDGVHWAYMLRDDSESSPNVWKFYGKIGEHEHYYLILRIFLDAIVGFLGMGATFWTKKSAFALPCVFVQPLLIFARIFAWSFRNRLPKSYRTEDFGYIVLEFVFPTLWFLLSTATIIALSQKEKPKRQQFRQPPLIVVSSSRTDNEESVQFEIDP